MKSMLIIDGSVTVARTTAVVMVTGNGEVTEQNRAAGTDEVLVKPVNPNVLILAVGKHVST